MYLACSVKAKAWVIPQTTGFVLMCLNKKPFILENLPDDAKANARFGEKLRGPDKCNYNVKLNSNTFTTFEVFYDCGNLPKHILNQAISVLEKTLLDKEGKGRPFQDPILEMYKALTLVLHSPSSLSRTLGTLFHQNSNNEIIQPSEEFEARLTSMFQ